MSLGCVPAVLGNISSLLALYPHSPFPLGWGGFPQALEEHSSTPIPFLPHVQGNLSTDRWEIILELGKTHSYMCGRLCSTPHRNGFFFWHFLAVTMVIGLATLQPLRDSVIYDLTPLSYPIFYFPGTTLKACSSAAPRLDTKVTLILITVCNTDPDTDIEGTKQNINSVSMSFFFQMFVYKVDQKRALPLCWLKPKLGYLVWLLLQAGVQVNIGVTDIKG